MITSKEVFAVRREKKVDEAYQLAIELNKASDADIWNIRVLAWCLVDIIKRDISVKRYDKIFQYAHELEKIQVQGSQNTYTNAFNQLEIERPVLTPHEDTALIAQRQRCLELVAQIQMQKNTGSTIKIVTSSEIYAKRKENVEEAYKMALQATACPNPGQMEVQALTWCLIDLIKRDFKASNYTNLEIYRVKILELEPYTGDNDILAQQVKYALSLCNPNAPKLHEAKAFCKQKNYAQAIACYSKIQNIPFEDRTSYGWALYYESKLLLEKSEHALTKVKTYLHTYLKLSCDRPSILHSQILWLAKNIAKANAKSLDLASFLEFWGFDSFRDEDFERAYKDGGGTFPALAEDATREACKAALSSRNKNQMVQLLPLLEQCISLYQDNIWLVHTKAKMLVQLGRTEEAQQYGRIICKNKIDEYWAWELLGDIYDNEILARCSCYAKALLCKKDNSLGANLHRKMAVVLMELEHYPQAKLEIETYCQLKNGNIDDDTILLRSQSWFSENHASQCNIDFYLKQRDKADALLFADTPWIEAVLGESFQVVNKAEKKVQKRKIYIKSKDYPFEVSILEKKLHGMDVMAGTPMQIKGEKLHDKPYQVFMLEPRTTGNSWDIFSSHVGIISYANAHKKTYHILIDRNVESFFHFDMLAEQAKEGDFIKVKVALAHRFVQGKTIETYKVLSAQKTTNAPSSTIYKHFTKNTIQLNNNMGFTNENIFVPPYLVDRNNFFDGDTVSGEAILNYDKKKYQWGWKAINIRKDE